MSLHRASIEDGGVWTSDARDQQTRGNARRAKGACADAGTQQLQAMWLSVLLLGMGLLWAAIELMRTTALTP